MFALKSISLVATVLAGTIVAQDAPRLDQEELEERFEERMREVQLVGSFTDDSKPAGTPLQEDSYTIHEMSKIDGTAWQVVAEIVFGEHSIPVEMEVDIEWAGDTPVLTVTDRKIPTLGGYSARVVFYGDRYAGLWQGSGYGGHMFGKVVPIEEEEEDSGATEEQARDDGNWPSFHGAGGAGVQNGWETPTTWDLASKENVLWTAPVPGMSHSSPVVWGDRLYVTTAVRLDEEEAELKVGLYGDIFPVKDEGEHEMRVLCLDRNTGDVLWTRTAHTGVPAVMRHPKGSHAASSPATDGKRVVAFFGSEGLYCYDIDGELLWTKNFGVLDSGYFLGAKVQWGFASSPVLHDDVVIVQCDVNGQSFLAALSAETGDEIWRTDRDEVPTWSTPTVDERAGRSQVICNGYKHIGGYDLKTGKELWKLVGGGDIPVPTPVISKDRVFIMNAHGRMSPIYAIQLDATGELSMDAEADPFMAWSHKRGGNYMQTPLVLGGYLYGCADMGILGCWDVETGEEMYRERLDAGRDGFTSSAVGAGNKIYCASEEGDVYVVKAGPKHEVLAINDLGEICMATPAISRGVLFYRTLTQVVAIGEK